MLVGALAAGPAGAEPPAAEAWPAWPRLDAPREGYLQAARAARASAAAAGFGWRGEPVDCLEPGFRCSWRVEAEVSRWRPYASVPLDRALATQVGLTPLWRQDWPRRGPRQWYVEGGIGANLLVPLYRVAGARFSTSLNFGSQLAVGVAFGVQREHELSLRVEHFSNAGLGDPNPGEDFLQLRYLRRL